jgi:zinc protease
LSPPDSTPPVDANAAPAAPDTTPTQMRTAPTVGVLPSLVTPKPISFRLSNGIEVVAVKREVAPIVAMNLILRTGSDHEGAARAGLASLTAEMMDEGAGDRAALEITEALERLGADLFLGAGRDGSQLTLQVPTTEFRAALDIASDIVLRPRMGTSDWERVLSDRLTALGQRRDQPESVADLVAALTLYGPEHPYGRPVEGFEETVRALVLDDVRKFHEQFWRPNNAILALAGDFDITTMKADLERAFGTWAPSPIPVAPPSPVFPALPRLSMVDRPGAPQSVVRVIGPGTFRHAPDRPALSMLNIILGGSFTSRLNFTLREKKGYTYGAGSSFSTYRRPSAFTARSSVFSEVTAPAVTDFLTEIGRMRTDDIEPQEITKARASLLGRTAESLSTASGTAATFAEIGLYELPIDEPARFISKIASTTAADLKALAARYLNPDQLGIVIVGDRATVEPKLREIGLPAPLMRGPDGERLGSGGPA